MTVLLIGETDDIHLQAIASELDDYIILDPEVIANNITITSNLYNSPSVYCDGELLEPTSIYWRNIEFDAFGGSNKDFSHTAATMQLFFNAWPDAVWCNPVSAFIEHYTKIIQYAKVTSLKPSTLFTNNVDDAIEFASHFDAVAVKPIAGGKYTKKLTKKKQIRKLKMRIPLCFQEYVEGTNVRTFVIGDEVFAADVVTDNIDFRTGDFDYIPIDLDAEHYQQCLDITKALGYRWTAIDWIRRNGQYYFLEANFSPMFLYFEQSTEYPIAKKLANILI